MNLLFVLENYLPHMGGVEVVFKNLCEGLVKKGHQVTIVTRRLKDTPNEEIIGGVKIKRVSSLRSRRLFSFTALYRVFKEAKNADIIHTTAFNGAPPGSIVGLLRRKPVIIHVHEVWIGMWDKVTSMSWLNAKIHNLLEKAIYALPYTKYICVSNSTKRQLLSIKTDPNKVQVIHNGYTPGFFDPKKWDGKKIRKKLGIDDKMVLFTWGRPGVSKGHEFAILAMEKIKDKIPKAHLVVMLSNKQTYKKRYQFLKNIVKEKDLEQWVSIIDGVPYKELGHYLKAADCIIIPSLSEGFGYTTLEACEMQVPVIATDNTSIPEVIWGKHILIPPRDPEAIADAVQKVKKGIYQTTKRKEFPWKDNIAAHEKLYGELKR